MFEPTGSQRDAASAIFNLPDYQVLSAVEDAEGVRRIEVETTAPPGCPVCGVLAVRVHSRRRQRLRDLPVAGPVELVWAKRRWFCDEARCRRKTFSEVTDQVPAYARSTARLCQALLSAVVSSGRAASEVARAHRVSWWLVASMISAAADLLTDPDDVVVRRLGVDEHRYRSVRFFRDPDGGWQRYEPWMTTLVDTDTGRVLGVVDGRDSAGVGTWLAARSQAWRDAVEVVAIDPSAAFRKALREQLPAAAVSVDAFHLVKLANDAVTAVRQRVIREAKGRRGRLEDPAWVNRRLLLRAGDTLSPRALARLKATLRADDPTDEIGAAWGIKEQLRALLTSGSLADAHEQKMRLGVSVLAADMPETDRLWATIDTWWDAIEVLIVTGVTNARTEAANTSIKQIKRTGRGYRNPANYRARILLASAARTAA
ncbi:ISL3 family transposase [Blastococcus sp. CCUG 61487]|uniref:ISL3 family transposase n=1 Tax=Blastococcus sp. CCUG 61487 TaxID=1840703 RepID=UPI0010C05771|nr:ISL3 family transposase [Blastococcus sp. CCUG 61487]TKJ29526.1 transposase [Blastococcus sp. CCUG 61487]